MRWTNSPLLSLVGALLALPAAAQVADHHSLTTWTHLGGAPNWTDDVPDTTAEFGMVDRLNSITNLSYTSPTVTLAEAGTYIADCRVKKFQDAVGAAPIDFIAIYGSGGAQTRLEVASQTVDEWVRTPNLIFSTRQANTQVTFVLSNADTSITKQNYDFDSIRIGRVDAGPVVHYSSMALDWGWDWGMPYYNREYAEPNSAYGVVGYLNNIWWLNGYMTLTLQPGIYTANARVQKDGGAWGQAPIDLRAVIAGNATGITYLPQVYNAYELTDDLVFDVTQPDTQVTFQWRDLDTSRQKINYRFDAFMLRKGKVIYSGSGCIGSGGDVGISMNPPMIGEAFNVSLDNCGPAAFVVFGTRPAAIDLTSIGAPGCIVHSPPIAAVGGATNVGVFDLTLYLPNDPALRGGIMYVQGLSVDSGANPLGIAVTRSGEITVSM